MRAVFAFLVLTLLSASALATQPTPGVWWNPQESGRGWNMEGQNDLWSISHFNYDQNGFSQFYVSVGIWDPNTFSIVGDLLAPNGGQCIGCTYVAPTSPSLGTMRFEFDNPFQGRAIYPNGTVINIEKFTYGFAGKQQELLGTWSTLWYPLSGTLGFGHSIYFNRTTPGSSELIDGRRVNFGAPRQVGASVAGTGPSAAFAAIVDVDANFNDYMYFIVQGDSLRGFACTATKTAPIPTLAQCTGVLNGNRFLTLSESVRAFPSPATTAKSASSASSVEDAARATAASDATSVHNETSLELLTLLAPYEQELRAAAVQLRQQLQHN